MLRLSVFNTCLLALAATLATGCGGGPDRIKPPSMSPSGVGSAAMDQYDTDGDGVVKGDELAKAPSLNAAIDNLDTDGDGGVSKSEVAARVQSWIDSKLGVTNARCKVTLDGKPLIGATITFEPEEFLGDSVYPATDETEIDGTASPRVAEENRANKRFSGTPAGFYKVKVSKLANGEETIPSRYNSETILGQEIAIDGKGMQKDWLEYDLSSKG